MRNSISHGSTSLAIPITTSKEEKIMSWQSALIGAASSAWGATEQNRAAGHQQREQQNFQERMSSTAYQRGMQDMKDAGLNPMLASKLGGASSPTGSMAPIQSVGGAATTGYQQGMQAETTRKKTESDVLLQTANRLNTEADTVLKEAQAPTANTKATIAKKIEGLVNIADKILDNGKPVLDKALATTGLKLVRLIHTARNLGTNESFLNNIFRKNAALAQWWRETKNKAAQGHKGTRPKTHIKLKRGKYIWK